MKIKMKTIITILLLSPLVAPAQLTGTGFWTGTPELLSGCKTYNVKSIGSSPIIQYGLTYTNCYGDVVTLNPFADGSSFEICSYDLPVAFPAAFATISETGYDCDGNIIYIPCGSETNAVGKNEFPAEFVSFIGSYTGNVTFHFTTGDVPDKVVVERMDGTVIYTTGWRGDPSYQSALSQGLANLGLPDETILPPGGMDGATYTFNKNFIDPNIRFKVYTSYWITGGSSWWVTVNCPN